MSGISTQKLLELLKPVATSDNLPEFIQGIAQDSRRIENGFVFAARLGGRTTGIDYLAEARRKGATMLMFEGEPFSSLDIPWIKVDKFRTALVYASKLIYGDPSKKLALFGITGTNGKTSTVHLLKSIFEASGEDCGMLSTVGYWTGKRSVEAPLTTPDIDQISALLSEAVETGAKYATMEVSSHALDQGRTWGLKFTGAGFTNLSVDHLDYHSSLSDYSAAKERLFRTLPLNSTAVVNVNGSWGSRILRACWSPSITIGGGNSGADMQVTMVEHTVAGGVYLLEWKEQKFEVKTPLVGVYQGENLALAAALALSQEIDMATVTRGIANLKAVSGRMESISCGQPFAVFVDYAHTPDALQRAIRSLRPLTKSRILVLFGCGGDRDRSKRPQMGKIASEEADRVFVTSDNPRTEDPEEIIREIKNGVPVNLSAKTTMNVDRYNATQEVLRQAEPGDIVLLAGKGSEWYQEINGVRHPYDDRVVSEEILRELGYKSTGDFQ